MNARSFKKVYGTGQLWDYGRATLDRDRPLIHALQALGALVRLESVQTRYWRSRFSGARTQDDSNSH